MTRVLLTVLVAVLVAVPVSIGTVVVASQGSGLQGPRGATGPAGEPGPPGPAGPRGRHGSDGSDGTSPSAGVNPPVAPDAGVDQTGGAAADDQHDATCALVRSVANLEPSPTRRRAIVQAALRAGCTVELDG